MEEKYITYETAVLAKQAGFNGLCSSYKTHGTDGSISYPCMCKNSDLANGAYAIPTQSLLQAWLREKHKMHLHICHFTENDKWHVDVYDLKDGALMNHPMSLTGYSSYEEALESGLQAALRYIIKQPK